VTLHMQCSLKSCRPSRPAATHSSQPVTSRRLSSATPLHSSPRQMNSPHGRHPVMGRCMLSAPQRSAPLLSHACTRTVILLPPRAFASCPPPSSLSASPRRPPPAPWPPGHAAGRCRRPGLPPPEGVPGLRGDAQVRLSAQPGTSPPLPEPGTRIKGGAAETRTQVTAHGPSPPTSGPRPAGAG
jgi:hypothetical protein